MRSLFLFVFGLLFLPSAVSAASFSDVPDTHPAYVSIEYLKEEGIIGGYPDGTFQPDKKVNRAEAIKIIVSQLTSQEDLAAYTSSDFTDVPAGAWFLPYVEAGKEKGIIDGPPKKAAFNGANPVLKVEFIKMLMLGNGENPDSYSEIRLPLSEDVTDVDQWYYPYLRYAMTASMIIISPDGTLQPGAELTRAETAMLIHRYMMYKQGRRVQALLSLAENEILIVLAMMEEENITGAEYASARSLLAARGAFASHQDSNVVKGALKTSEAFRSLIRGYKAGSTGDLDESIRLGGEAWNLASSAREFNPDLQVLSEKVQEMAKNMADSARALKEKEATPDS